jgi:putative PEP-CTERM system histidine kinase
MVDIGLISYASAAVLFAALSVLLLVSRQGHGFATYLLVATAVSVLWAGFLAVETRTLFTVEAHPAWYAIEVLRNAAWFAFMAQLLFRGEGILALRPKGLWVHAAWVIALAIGLATQFFAGGTDGAVTELPDIQLAALLALALMGLFLVEQLFRNTRAEMRWSVKHVYLGLALMFGFDVVVFSEGFLFHEPDPTLWNARGVVNALVVPLLAMSATRNPQWASQIFVSRHVVFYTTSLIVVGAFLLAMAIGGYYVRLYGGSWGEFVQIVLALGSIVLVGVLALSASVRARLRIFLGKHFYRNQYDYREEWLGFMDRLGAAKSSDEARRAVIMAIAGLLQSSGGLLFERTGKTYACVAAQGTRLVNIKLDAADPMVQFLERKNWIVDIAEHERDSQRYPDLQLGSWLTEIPRAWLIVPLRLDEALIGWVVLLESIAPRRLNWEDWDLLKTTGRAAAAHLVLLETSEALSEARQFEAFNRLSAFVVHDLKNTAAQLELVVSNATRHRDKPGFMDDAIATIDNATVRMKRLLGQLRTMSVSGSSVTRAELDDVIREVAQRCGRVRPVPALAIDTGTYPVDIDRDRLSATIEHLVQNAQEATPDDGEVTISLSRQGERAQLEIADTGCGMDEQFVRERLFKPFDTTKGNAGMGIGAYEAREFVEGLGGEIKVTSRPGEGTRFTLTLPLASAMEAAMGRPRKELVS